MEGFKLKLSRKQTHPLTFNEQMIFLEAPCFRCQRWDTELLDKLQFPWWRCHYPMIWLQCTLYFLHINKPYSLGSTCRFYHPSDEYKHSMNQGEVFEYIPSQRKYPLLKVFFWGLISLFSVKIVNVLIGTSIYI